MSDYETQVCERHGEEVALVSRTTAESLGIPYGCQACRVEIRSRPDPATMTRQERRDELEALLTEPNLQGFDIVWERTDLLVGRGTYTHELAYPEYLYHEIMTGVTPSVEGIVAKFPPEMPVLVVEPVEGSGE